MVKELLTYSGNGGLKQCRNLHLKNDHKLVAFKLMNFQELYLNTCDGTSTLSTLDSKDKGFSYRPKVLRTKDLCSNKFEEEVSTIDSFRKSILLYQKWMGKSQSQHIRKGKMPVYWKIIHRQGTFIVRNKRALQVYCRTIGIFSIFNNKHIN